MRSSDESPLGVLLAPDSGKAEPAEGVRVRGVATWEDPELLRRQVLVRRTLGEKLVDGLRRAWHGPDPEPLTADEMRMIMRRAEDEIDSLPERVPPDDPDRLAWEAELRAIGVRPAKRWNFPDREPRQKPGVWASIKYRVSRGW
ncbi:hypothetical protein [Longimicrobium sp.]|uniref:hypothetical protein n=1 Tax=Longimicrobium sp. TaxID=2029185 RepID=UPI003B3B0C73